ncbi:hypothetical protein AB4Z21_01725 [Paenibacillus sp. MCAF20]
MPNNNPLNRSDDELHGQLVDSYGQPGTTAPPRTGATAAARHFNVQGSNSGSLGILGGTVDVSLRINNPSASGRTVIIESIGGYIDVSLSLLSSFNGQMTAYSGGTLTSPSAATPANLFLTSTTTSVATATTSTSGITGGTLLLSYPVYPGPFRLALPNRFNLPSGTSLTVNVRGSLSLLGIIGTGVSVSWIET